MARDICEIVGDRIRTVRKERQWTQQMLADHSELTREHVNRIEDGSREMGLRTLERIAKAMDIEMCDLLP